MAYYFPQWHHDPLNDALHRPGWTEWETLKEGTPRFPGHQQPKRPQWGYVDEANPSSASRAVSTALDHGVDGFIVDWYWYDNKPFLERALGDGILSADRIDELRFALMWANHDWAALYPAQSTHPATLLPAPNSPYHASCAFEYIADRYLTHSSYWRLNGAAYFSLYDIPAFVRGMGGIAEAARVLDAFRDIADRSGAGALHLNAVTNFQIPDVNAVAVGLGLDSVTHYTWWHHDNAGFDTYPTTTYDRVHSRAREVWREQRDKLSLPYLANVTMGWDPSPRTLPRQIQAAEGYPYTSVLVDNSPAAVRSAMEDALRFASAPTGTGIVTINAWNEWTEGSYLEPDETNGYSYLQAIRNAVDCVRADSVEGGGR